MNPSTPNLSGFEHFLIVGVVFYLVMMVIMLIATVKIVTKAGYTGWWVAVTFVPFIGPLIAFVLFFVFAFSEWPIQRELAMAKSRHGGGYQSGPPSSPWAPPMPTPTYPPSGYTPTGYAPSGYAPSGYSVPAAPVGSDLPSGQIPGRDEPAGDVPSGDVPGRDEPAGDVPSGDAPSGNRPSRYLSPRQDPPPPPPPPSPLPPPPSGGMV
jgi:hypothetical protein